MRRRAALVLAVTAAMACTVDAEQEQVLGANAAAQIDAEMPIIADAEITGYVTQLGLALARPSDDRDREWRFRVVDAEQVNAFALPGGYVYVNRGLIERAESASELAGVLGHEVAHVLLRHSAERIEKAQRTNVGVSVVCALTSLCSSDAARVAINVGGAALFARFSRHDELEADSAAVDIVRRAGYDPRGIATMFESLMAAREQRPDIVAAWFGSHPLEEDRVAAVERIIASTPAPNGAPLRRDDPAFLAFRQRVRALPPPPSPPRSLPR